MVSRNSERELWRVVDGWKPNPVVDLKYRKLKHNSRSLAPKGQTATDVAFRCLLSSAATPSHITLTGSRARQLQLRLSSSLTTSGASPEACYDKDNRPWGGKKLTAVTP